MKPNVVNNSHNNRAAVSVNDHKHASDFRTHSANEKNKFQLLFVKTVEKSQTEIEQNNRLKNSTAKDTGDAQPKMSGQQKLQSNVARFERIGSTGISEKQVQDVNERTLSSNETLTSDQLGSDVFSINLDIQNTNTAALLFQNLRNVYSPEQDNLDPHVDVPEHTDNEVLSEDTVHQDTQSETILIAMRLKTPSDKGHQEQHDHQPVPNTFSLDGEKKSEEPISFVGQVQLTEQNLFVNQELPVVSKSSLQNRFGTDAWGTEFCKKIVWMVSGGEQSAVLTLNPPHLGPIRVEVTMQNNLAHTVFESGNAEVRLALESGLSKLREMLALRGVELGRTSVKAESAQITTTAQKSRVLNRLLNTFV